jgi:ribosomal protein S18 acetylase RimI-like enzyme
MTTRTCGSLQIRQATAKDADSLANLAARTFFDTYDDLTRREAEAYIGEFLSPSAFEAHIKSSTSAVFVAEKYAMVGYLLLEVSRSPILLGLDNHIECVRLFVDTDSKGLRIGSNLLDRAISYSKRNKSDVMWLKVWDQNTRAIEFYEQKGFQVQGSVEYTEGGMDDEVLIMALFFGDSSRGQL